MTPYMIALLLCIGAVSNVEAQRASDGRPWQVTDDERIRARSNHTKAAERVREANERCQQSAVGRLAARGGKTACKSSGDIISGRLHPELFLREELFRFMVRGAFAEDVMGRAIYRNARSADLARLGLPKDFWARVEVLVGDYLDVLRRTRQLNTEAGARATSDPVAAARMREESSTIQREQCARLADALAATRAAFGQTTIDRFLYESVAKTASIALAKPDSAESLHRITRGCK